MSVTEVEALKTEGQVPRLVEHALLDFLPRAHAGIPRAMDGLHNWEM